MKQKVNYQGWSH